VRESESRKVYSPMKGGMGSEQGDLRGAPRAREPLLRVFKICLLYHIQNPLGTNLLLSLV
jgi:hypothetical protein